MKEYKTIFFKFGKVDKMAEEIQERFNNLASEGWEYCTKFSTQVSRLVVFEREK